MSIDGRVFRFANGASTTLAQAASASATSIAVATGGGDLFPEFDPTYDEAITCLLWDASLTYSEIVYITAIDGDTITIERAKEGSAARDFPAGSILVNTVTAGFFQQQSDTADFTQTPGATDNGDNSITITWTAVVPGVGNTLLSYCVYRSLNGAAYVLLDTVGPTILEYTDTPVTTAGNTYQYYVSAKLEYGQEPTTYETATLGQLNRPVYLAVSIISETITGIMRSFDCVNWSAPQPTKDYPVDISYGWRSMAYNPNTGRIIVLPFNCLHMMYSDDGGQMWTPLENVMPEDGPWLDALWIEELSLFVACNANGSATYGSMWSEDGLTWTGVDTSIISPGMGFNSLIWNAGLARLFATGDDDDVFYSDDGKTWAKITAGHSSFSESVHHGGDINNVTGTMVFGHTEGSNFVDTHVIRSVDDGVSWQEIDTDTNDGAFGGGVAYHPVADFWLSGYNDGVGEGDNSLSVSVNDGATWVGIEETYITPQGWRDVKYFEGVGIVAIGTGGLDAICIMNDPYYPDQGSYPADRDWGFLCEAESNEDGDPYFANVAFLCAFEGYIDNRGTMPESQDPSHRTISDGGGSSNSHFSTAQTLFGSVTSLELDGTDDYITCADDALFQIEGSDFTIESWVQTTDLTHINTVISKRIIGGTQSEYQLQINTDGSLQFRAWTGSGTTTLVDLQSAAGVIVADTWAFVAIDRYGDEWALTVNGVVVASTTQAGSAATNTELWRVGDDQTDTARRFDGHINDTRMTHGVSRYSAAAFTTPTQLLPRIPEPA